VTVESAMTNFTILRLTPGGNNSFEIVPMNPARRALLISPTLTILVQGNIDDINPNMGIAVGPNQQFRLQYALDGDLVIRGWYCQITFVCQIYIWEWLLEGPALTGQASGVSYEVPKPSIGIPGTENVGNQDSAGAARGNCGYLSEAIARAKSFASRFDALARSGESLLAELSAERGS